MSSKDKKGRVTGIFIGGIPLEDHLKIVEDKEKGEDIKEIFKKESCKYSKAIVHHIKAKRDIAYHSLRKRQGVATKVRHLTIEEIRKEYGIMARPEKSMAANVLLAFCENQGQSFYVREISEKVNAPTPSVSTVITRFVKANVLSKKLSTDKEKGKFKYYMPDSEKRNFDELLTIYRQSLRESQKSRAKIHRLPPDSGTLPIPGTTLYQLEAAKDVNVNVKIELSGKIEFLFGFINK